MSQHLYSAYYLVYMGFLVGIKFTFNILYIWLDVNVVLSA